MAMLVVLERLTPAERAAFVLHDVFRFSFEDVGRIVGRSPEACRQLASRARRRVEEDTGPPRFEVDPAALRRSIRLIPSRDCLRKEDRRGARRAMGGLICGHCGIFVLVGSVGLR